MVEPIATVLESMNRERIAQFFDSPGNTMVVFVCGVCTRGRKKRPLTFNLRNPAAAHQQRTGHQVFLNPRVRVTEVPVEGPRTSAPIDVGSGGAR